MSLRYSRSPNVGNCPHQNYLDKPYTIVYQEVMLVKLGTELRTAREQMGVSLQAIADAANISTAYLQKLERGEVGTPSPRILRRLSSSLDLPYLGLMELAGYLDEAGRFGSSLARVLAATTSVSRPAADAGGMA